MTLVAETRMDLPTSSGTAPRYTLEDGVLGSMLDEYLREVSGADLHALGGGAANRDQGRASQQPVILQSQPSPPEQAVNQSSRQRAVTRPHKLKSASQPDWTHSSGTEDSSPRPRRPAPRKKSRDRRLSSRRTQELQEKNRQAQQRFRQRQREKVTELEDHVTDLNQRISELLKDKAELEQRVDELSGRPAPAGSTLPEREASQPLVLPKQEEGLNMLDASDFMDDVTLTICLANPVVLSPERIREISSKDLIQIWKEYRQELTRLMSTAGNEPEPQTSARIKQLVYELMVLLMRVAVHNPVVSKSFVAGNMERSDVSEVEDMQMWRDVMLVLQLTADQKQQMIELRQFFLVKLRAILDRRKTIHSEITRSLPEAYSARHAAKQFLRAHNGMEQLKANMREEHVLKLDWISSMFNLIWTPLQTARCMVLSWPYTPDTFAIASWVAVEQGDPSALLVCSPSSPTDSQSAGWTLQDIWPSALPQPLSSLSQNTTPSPTPFLQPPSLPPLVPLPPSPFRQLTFHAPSVTFRCHEPQLRRPYLVASRETSPPYLSSSPLTSNPRRGTGFDGQSAPERRHSESAGPFMRPAMQLSNAQSDSAVILGAGSAAGRASSPTGTSSLHPPLGHGAVTSAEPAVSRGQWPASLSPQGSFEGRHTPCGPADSALSAGLEASSQPYLVCTTTTPPPVMLGEDIRCRGAHEGTLPALGAQLDAEGPDGLFEDPFQVNGLAFPPNVPLPPNIFPPLSVQSPLLMPSVQSVTASPRGRHASFRLPSEGIGGLSPGPPASPSTTAFQADGSASALLGLPQVNQAVHSPFTDTAPLNVYN